MERIYSPGYFETDQWQVQKFAQVLRRAKVMLHSTGLSADVLARCFVEPVETVEEGIGRAVAEYGPNATFAVIPQGPYVIPKPERQCEDKCCRTAL